MTVPNNKRLYARLKKLHPEIPVVEDPELYSDGLLQRERWNKNPRIVLRAPDAVTLAHELAHYEEGVRGVLYDIVLDIIDWFVVPFKKLNRYITVKQETDAVKRSIHILENNGASNRILDYTRIEGRRYIDKIRNTDPKYFPMFWEAPDWYEE